MDQEILEAVNKIEFLYLLHVIFGAMRVNGYEKNILNWNNRMNNYNKSLEFSKIEIARQRQLAIADFVNEIEILKVKYNEAKMKIIKDNFQKWLEEDIEREKMLYN